MSKVPEYKAILLDASKALAGFAGRTLDVLEIARPPDLDYAVHLSKVVSKLSPLVGNMIEYGAVSFLNEKVAHPKGRWERQDPGFPDNIFRGSVTPAPGIEIKAWFPWATEITARFKGSIVQCANDQTNVALLAWVPEFIIFGKPRILDVWIDTARSVAEARDKHYHNPPDYLVFEPEDTSARTSNLQQTNTSGYKLQSPTKEQLAEAKAIVDSWGPNGRTFSASPEYQMRLAGLLGKFKYRLDTNFAKMDRIEHTSLEEFKSKVLKITFAERTIAEWGRVLANAESNANKQILGQLIGDKRLEAPEVFNGDSVPSVK